MAGDFSLALASTTLPKDIPSRTAEDADLPELSTSPGSESEEEAVEFTSESSPVDIEPRIRRQDSCVNRTRSPRSESFEKLVVSILDQKEALNKSPIDLPAPAPQKEKRPSPVLQRSGSTTTESSGRSSEDGSVMSTQASPETALPVRTHSVVKGFSPSIASIPNPTVRISPDTTDAKPIIAPQRFSKKNATFTVGASASSSEAAQPSLKQLRKPASKRMFQLGSSNSSEEGPSLKSSLRVPPFKGHLSSVDSDDEMDDEVDESAIDDDDESDWEDSEDVSGTPSMDDKSMFQRIPSSTQLVTRPSLITLGLATERARRLGPVVSQSTSALHRARPTQNGSTMAGSPNDSDENPLMMKGAKTAQLQRINEVPRSQAQPINAIPVPVRHQAALSPRATRRHMLATELTDSLRRHIVWERQYKHSTANAVLKRRHTSNDLANLKQHPEPVCMKKAEDQNATSFNQFFNKDVDGGYHAKGW